MKIATLIFVTALLLLSYECRAENVDPADALDKPIHETFSCKPFGKNGAQVAKVDISTKATYNDVFYKGDQGITGTATAIVVKAGKKTMLEVPELKLKGTAANSTKGIYYELHPISAGDVTEIFVASPASGKGGSAVTLKNEDIYSMDCNLLSQ